MQDDCHSTFVRKNYNLINKRRVPRRFKLTSASFGNSKLEAYLHFPTLHFLNSKSEEELCFAKLRGPSVSNAERIVFVLFSTFCG